MQFQPFLSGSAARLVISGLIVIWPRGHLQIRPDFLHINGDSIYADDTIEAVSTSPWNKGWANVMPSASSSPAAAAAEKSKVLHPAESLESFRERYKYHLEDRSYAALLASTAVYNTWDDHEIADVRQTSSICPLGCVVAVVGTNVMWRRRPLLSACSLQTPTSCCRSAYLRVWNKRSLSGSRMA